MRTTVTLPDDVYQVAKDVAHDMHWTLSEAVTWLMRRGIGTQLPEPRVGVNEVTGLPSFITGRLITASEVKRFLDEEE